MNDKFFVSFNSPQCGWMSIGFEGGGTEFHTTTAHTPHERALPELLTILAELLNPDSAQKEFTLQWNRNPEEFDFHFARRGEEINLQIFQYPTEKRDAAEKEKVFDFTGGAYEICRAFYETFKHMEKEIHVDEFEFNWRQPFPMDDFKKFEKEFLNYGR